MVTRSRRGVSLMYCSQKCIAVKSNYLSCDGPGATALPSSYFSQPSPLKGSTPNGRRTCGKSTMTQLSIMRPSRTFQQSM